MQTHTQMWVMQFIEIVRLFVRRHRLCTFFHPRRLKTYFTFSVICILKAFNTFHYRFISFE